jgi:hypothetical protein
MVFKLVEAASEHWCYFTRAHLVSLVRVAEGGDYHLGVLPTQSGRFFQSIWHGVGEGEARVVRRLPRHGWRFGSDTPTAGRVHR